MTPRSSSPADRLAWLAALAAAAVFVVFAVTRLPSSLAGSPDFPNYYFTGERVLDGRPVYDEVAPEVRERFGRDYDVYPADPPAAVVVLSPLSLLGYEAAWLLFAGLSVAIIAFVMYRLGKDVGMSGPWAAALVGASLISTNFRFLITRNHMETLLLLFCYLGWRSLRRGRGGAWWGLAAALKLFPALWLAGLAAARRWRTLAVSVGASVALSAAGALTVGWPETVRYVTEVIPRSQQWYGALGNYSLVSFGTALVGQWLGWVLAVAAMVGLGTWFLTRPGGPDGIVTAGTALALLLSPLAWHNYLVLTFPGLVLLGSRARFDSPVRRLGFVALVAGLGFWGPVVTGSKLGSVLLSFVPTYALVALFILSMRTFGRLGASSWPSASETPSPTSP